MIGIIILISVLVMFIIWDTGLHPVQWISKLIPPKPEPRYELRLPDEGMVSDVAEVDHGKVEEERTTLTGETYEERKAWHDCGELSPGEHAMARAIREHLQANSEWRKLMD